MELTVMVITDSLLLRLTQLYFCLEKLRKTYFYCTANPNNNKHFTEKGLDLPVVHLKKKKMFFCSNTHSKIRRKQQLFLLICL